MKVNTTIHLNALKANVPYSSKSNKLMMDPKNCFPKITNIKEINNKMDNNTVKKTAIALFLRNPRLSKLIS